MHKTKDFFYNLPDSLIAQTPAEPRDSSRLLVWSKTQDQISHKNFYDIESYLNKGDVLVVNNTKVLPARLFAKTSNGANVELLLLKRLSKDEWETMVKPGKKAKIGAVLTIAEDLRVEILAHTDSGGRVVRFLYNGVFERLLEKYGNMPLPPYIKTPLKEKQSYQTIYCKTLGSSAAPTAGLHFTPELIQRLKNKGVIVCEVLLHVGLGTFRPVKTESITDHKMHSEYYEITQTAADIINAAKSDGRRIIAVGTTTVRTLESASSANGLVAAGSGDTDIFIYPPYSFKCADAIITNFHLPESTLIMLISAFAGRQKTLELYNTAVEENYRFFSFGDAMFIY